MAATTFYQPVVGTVRQPFAPLNTSRLQTLTSLKNRQNALPQPLASSTKRKVASFDDDIDAENIDPSIFSKRSKGENTTTAKPSAFVLTKSPVSPVEFTPTSPSTTRHTLTPKSPARINTASTRPSLSTTPAGRSPTRKRIGILNRRKTTTRIDPPHFSPSSSLPFSLATALSGTTPLSRPQASIPVLATPVYKPSWDFEIHEDTHEETLTNLMEHSTYTLDISSDEESATRPRDEGKGKENVPPMGEEGSAPQVQHQHQQQLTSDDGVKSRLGRRRREENEIDVDRQVLGEVPIGDLYADGAAGEVVIVPGDDEGVQQQQQHGPSPLSAPSFDFSVVTLSTTPVAVEEGSAEEQELDRECERERERIVAAADELMQMTGTEALAPQPAALLQPMEKAEEGWQLWESGSAKGDE